jgi:Helicase associated domain
VTGHKERWEHGIAVPSKFREREGHCCPARDHIEGKFNLGQWVSVQRYRKNLLPAERKRRLDTIGFVWDWRDCLAVLVKFRQRYGHCFVPSLYNEGVFKLGYWVSTQRRYRDEMSAERRARLNNIGFVWNAHTGRPGKISVPNLPRPHA